ncbi:tubulin polyglutamylase TTLL5-like isoform X2 [Biomphalaria glabrata]|uniref:Tubulin--tyrosine ligase-like protein 5 n=1 Tax=Biomphalaria glabrata TaxID=6526 RepID=A0A9W3AQR3_BIOGL|nr:tubulin polyglutamylase TTLL5-like isoform X2 [Biomphalaria glabrata]
MTFSMDLIKFKRGEKVHDLGAISSMTPSEKSENDYDDDLPSCSSDQDSDYESEYGKESIDDGRPFKIHWSDTTKRAPVLEFNAEAFFNDDTNLKKTGQECGLICKVTGNAQIMREILLAHGFYETHRNTRCFNLNWAANHPSPFYIRKMAHFQTINHFPQTKELTRKDKLFRNVVKMQKTYGKEPFDFVPQTFILPNEYRSFCSHFKKDSGPYILKPVGLSRGRGVTLITSPKEALRKTEAGKRNVVCKYIPNPLMLNGYKFDLRIYVAVTSFDPLVIYMYKEGLTRFATVKYNMHSDTFSNLCMHLTNYSINMSNEDYVKNTDPEVEDFGNKWSLGALLRFLRSTGKDTRAIMVEIEDVVIKTVLSVEWNVGLACKRYQHHKNNCFELFGFDILLDENYKPWLIEVNLSPSLGCDTPLDIKIKSNMLCDLLNLVGIRCYSPISYFCGSKEHRFRRKLKERLQVTVGYYYYTKCREAIHLVWGLRDAKKQFKEMMEEEKNRHFQDSNEKKETPQKTSTTTFAMNLTAEEVEMIRQVREEDTRAGGWLRIFPAVDSWDKYWKYLSFPTKNNLVLHQRLYPEMHVTMSAGRVPGADTTIPTEAENQLLLRMTGTRAGENQISKSYIQSLYRVGQYETPLEIIPSLGFGGAVNTDDSSSSQDVSYFDDLIIQDLHQIQADKLKAAQMYQERAQKETGLWASYVTFNNLKKYIVSELSNGATLSEVQARTSFSQYLRHIKNRLVQSFEGQGDGQQELMDLVKKFLQRASVYLTGNLKLDFPDEKVPVSVRGKLMANQLTNFIKVYSERTCEMIKEEKSNKEQKKSNEEFKGLNASKFMQYIQSASETDLEELLITFAQHNKSIEIFFGGKPEASNIS